MKHSTLFVTVMMLAVFLCGTSAFMQQGSGGQGQPGLNAAKVNSYINSGSRHKLILGSEDVDVYNDLISKAAIVEEIDYGSFKQVIVNEQAAGGREAMRALRVPVRDDQDLIMFNGYVVDTNNPEMTYAKIPGDLRQTDMFNAVSKRTRPRGGLYIVQFAGPIKDLWLHHLKGTGAEIVTPIASNAYVVRASAQAAVALIQLKNKHSFTQYLGDYDPVYRLSPRMRDMRNGPAETLADVTVQVIAGRGARRTINELKAMASQFIGSHRVLNYHNVSLKVSAGQLGDIARMDNVYAVEERGTLQRFDEVQSQIVAGNLSGNVPSGPTYLSFLSNLGINPSQFSSFAVNVVDDAYTIRGHPDLPDSRIAFENNPYGLCGPQSGHGFLNAHIVGGYNDGSGFPFEDANGFNYGLGIAPYARVGITAIPLGSQCNGNPIPFPEPSGSIEWESVAYGQGARISTNSWGNPGISHYDARAQVYDSIVRDAQPGTPGLQQMIEVFAVGNDGKQILRRPDGSLVIRPRTSAVHPPATAKNVISVGASENVRQFGTDGCEFFNTDEHADSANDVAAFSSRGPVAELPGILDGRTKPDIMAPGTRIVAGIPQSNYSGIGCNLYFPPVQIPPGQTPPQTLYTLSSGTSQSAPAIAGAAALVYAGFVSNGQTISPAMMKAYLMNSTTYMTGSEANDTLPSNNQGMGRLDLTRAFNGQLRMFWDQHLTMTDSGQTFQAVGSVHIGPRPFRVTLAWTDAPGPVNNAAYVNDLDLEVTINGVTYKGNVFSGANSASGGNADFRNNVESVFLPAGTVGDFTARVIARNLRGDGVPGNGDVTDQDFALLISNAFCEPPHLSNLVATASSATRVDLTWNTSLGTFDHFEVERTQNINSPFITVASNVTGTSFSDTTVSSGITYLYRVRAASGCNTAFSDYSNTDMATTIIFTDDPLIAGITIVKAQHLLQLRQAVNSVRAAANQVPFNWAEVIQPGVAIKATHIQELRNVLNPARNALGFPSRPFTDNPLVPGVLIKKAHVEEIRQDVK